MPGLDPRIAQFAATFMTEGQRGFHIDGFGPGDPPPPPINPDNLAEREPPPAHDEEEPEPAHRWPQGPPIPSPLVDLGTKLTAPTMTTTGAVSHSQAAIVYSQAAELSVLDAAAVYKSQSVTLTEQEKAAIAQIVLRAIVNRAKAQYDALLKDAPRRVRVRRTNAEAGAGDQGGVRGGEGVGRGGDGKRQRRRRKPAVADDAGSGQGAQEAPAVEG